MDLDLELGNLMIFLFLPLQQLPVILVLYYNQPEVALLWLPEFTEWLDDPNRLAFVSSWIWFICQVRCQIWTVMWPSVHNSTKLVRFCHSSPGEKMDQTHIEGGSTHTS